MSIRRNPDFTILKIIWLLCINKKSSLYDNIFLKSNLHLNNFLNTPFNRICKKLNVTLRRHTVEAVLQLHSIYNLGAGKRELVSTTPRLLRPLRKPSVPIVRGPAWVLGPHWTSTEDPRTIQCVASRYTHYTIPAATKTSGFV